AASEVADAHQSIPETPLPIRRGWLDALNVPQGSIRRLLKLPNQQAEELRSAGIVKRQRAGSHCAAQCASIPRSLVLFTLMPDENVSLMIVAPSNNATPAAEI